ncbi:MAG: MFS transporter [Gemella haemolysans]|uniref:MFS transporter n=1 Tax=Gemella haemolysans TaxID=1379 RepID=UPI0029109C30|nr:MFS transporter [Gemella haemolysans]MDU4713791.1 MFS transporter [Gemella haemolysans]
MFKNKNFSILLFGRLITNFGDSIYSIATLTLIYSLTKSTFYSGITLFLISFTAILQIFISPIISKFDVKKFLIISQLIQAIILLVITYLIFINKLHITTLIIFIVCISFINQIVYPIQLGLLPKIVKQQELVKANSLFSIAYQGSDALFNSIGGFIITVFGTIFAFIINSLTFFINSVLFIFLSSDLSKNEKNITTQENYLSKLSNGIKIWNTPLLKPLLIGIIIINFSTSSLLTVLPEYSETSYFYGILLSASGLGILIGAFLSNKKILKNIRLGTLYITFAFGIAVSWGLLSILNNNSITNKIINFSLFLFGWILIGILNTYSQTMIQCIVNKDKLDVAMSTMIGLSIAFSPLGALIAGILSIKYNTKTIIIITSLLIFCVFLFWLFNNNIRKLPSFSNLTKEDNNL